MSLIEIFGLSGDKVSLMNITPSKVKRNWMDETQGLAYRCIPLNIANEYGWVCHSPSSFTATWDGGVGREAIKIVEHGDGPPHFPQSHFGHGILTLPPDFLIKTPKNISIYIRGISNTGYENIYPLDGIVETDWLPFTFTMNYKFLKPGSITFKKGDPVFMFFPIDRNFIESFDIEQKDISLEPEFYSQYKKYGEARQQHLDSNNQKPQRFYVSGTLVDERAQIDNHKIVLKLKSPQPPTTEEI